MGRRSRETGDPRLTDAELEVMRVLWALGEADATDVADQLGDGRAYSTALTLLRILEGKGFARSRRDGRRNLFTAASPRSEWESAAVADLVRRVFSGDPAVLVRRLLDSDAVQPDEIEQIRDLLQRRRP